MANKSRKDNRGRALRKGECQRKDNRYSYSYMDPYGKRRTIYALDIVELRKREAELVRLQLDGVKGYAMGNATLNQLVDRYLHTKTDIRPSTMHNYVYMYNHLARESIGTKKICELKYSDFLCFYNHVLDDLGIKVGTLEHVHDVIHPALTMAVRDNIIRMNPSDGAMMAVKKAPGRKRGKRHALTLEQQRAFLNYVVENPLFYEWGPLFTVLLGTGMRIGECLGLRWEDIDFKNRVISVNHALVYYSKNPGSTKDYEKHMSDTKTDAGIRLIPMMDRVYDALQEQRKMLKECGIKSETVDGMTGFCFVTDNGTILGKQRVNDVIHRIVKYYNDEEERNAKKENREPFILPDFSAHVLRHSFCSRMCENETNIKVIQSIMGHSDIATTMDIYAEVTDAKKADALNALAAKIDLF